MKWIVIAVLAWAFWWAFVSVSRAGTYWSAAEVQQSISIAHAAWPNSPCSGRETVLWDLTDSTGALLGRAFPKVCTVHIDWPNIVNDKAPAFDSRHLIMLCSVLTHEFGHLDGLGHSPDPKSIMFAEIGYDNISPACKAAFERNPMKHRNVQHANKRRDSRAATFDKILGALRPNEGSYHKPGSRNPHKGSGTATGYKKLKRGR